MKKRSLPQPPPPASSPHGKNLVVWISAVLVFIVSMIVFAPMLQNGFIDTWDDGVYVTGNQLLHDLSWQGIRNIFRYGDEFQRLINNYHPVTTLSLALNYQAHGLSPSGYHLTNMIFHGMNSVLVFLFIFLLAKKRLVPALVSGLLFAIHPMHVESVAWISERKDVLYTFFFIAGLIAYLKYREDEKIWKLVVTLVLFLCSCLSKAMAVPFPLVLLLIDYFQRRPFSRKLIVEKIPFFLVALIFGLMSVHLQSISAINKFETFTIYQRMMHASYGFTAYLLKFFDPSELSAFYPYPAITVTGLLPLSFRIAPFILLVIAAMIIWLSTRKGDVPRLLVFGILFYFFTIALVLQFLSVGKAIMADRYAYVPYIGLSFILGMLADHLIRKKAVLNYLGYGLLFILLIMMVVFSFLANERIKIWNNDITLWSDALNKYPDGRLNFIYEKRAEQYLIEERYEQALEDYLIIVRQDPGNDNALECVGRIYGKYYNNLDMAIEYLRKANAVNPQNHYALKSLGVAMGLKGDYPRSLEYLLKAYELDKTDTMLLRNIAASYSYLGMPDKAREFQLMSQPKGMK